MAQIIKSIKVILCCVILHGCTTIQKDTGNINANNIKGLWGFLRQNSTYVEVYFTDSIYVCFLPDDVLYRKYKIKDDTLFVYYMDNRALDSLRLKMVNEDRIDIVHKDVIIMNHRIRDSVFNASDWEKIIAGDEDVLYKYRMYYFTRGFEAEN